MRNRIINGAMVIDQRNAGASVTATTSFPYCVDRWIATASVNSKFTVQQNAGSVTPPPGFTNYLGVTSSSAYSLSVGDYFYVGQKIEGYNIADLGWGTLNGKTVTLSFWVQSSLTGTFGGSITNPAGTQNYPFGYTITSANTWQQVSVTIPAPTIGSSWGTGTNTGLVIVFSIGVGSTYSSTPNSWTSSSFIFQPSGSVSIVGTNSATFYITGVQLEKGSVATPFEYRQYGQELALCQRYYYKHNNTWGYVVNAAFTTLAGYPLKVTMRSQPTMDSGAAFTASSGNNGTPILYSGTGTGTDGNTVFVYSSANNWTLGAVILLIAGFSAEL